MANGTPAEAWLNRGGASFGSKSDLSWNRAPQYFARVVNPGSAHIMWGPLGLVESTDLFSLTYQSILFRRSSFVSARIRFPGFLGGFLENPDPWKEWKWTVALELLSNHWIRKFPDHCQVPERPKGVARKARSWRGAVGPQQLVPFVTHFFWFGGFQPTKIDCRKTSWYQLILTSQIWRT